MGRRYEQPLSTNRPTTYRNKKANNQSKTFRVRLSCYEALALVRIFAQSTDYTPVILPMSFRNRIRARIAAKTQTGKFSATMARIQVN